MVLKEVVSSADFDKEIRKPQLTVAKYYTTWCGPCRAIAPFVETLVQKYPMVNFIQIDGDKSEIVHERGVKGFPTFQFYVSGKMVDQMTGGDPNGLESRIIRLKVDSVESFAGKGNTLSAAAPGASGSDVNSAASLREARLKALQSSMPPPSNSTNTNKTSSSTSALQASILNHDAMDVDSGSGSGSSSVGDADADLARALAMSVDDAPATTTKSSSSSSSVAAPNTTAPTTASATKSKSVSSDQEKLDMAEAEAEQALEDQKWGDEMVPLPVDENLLKEMLDMGFSDTRARKGIYHGITLEGALQWITDNENDPNIDQAYMVKKSDTMPKPVLTEEEKAQKLLDMKNKIAKRKAEKVRIEKEMEIKREKERRETGKSLTDIQEERDRLARKRELERQKKEKLDAEKEKQRLRAEIAHDKEMRKLNKGVLPSVLGVGGYNPSAGATCSETPALPTTDGTTGSATVKVAAPVVAAAPVVVKKVTPSSTSTTTPAVPLTRAEKEAKIDAAIQTLMKYRTASDGGNALKLLLTFVKNVNDNPQDPKYRSINTDSNAFKSKLAALIGPMILLRALGFQKSTSGVEEDEGKLKLNDGDMDIEFIASTTEKLIKAEATYRQMNPV